MIKLVTIIGARPQIIKASALSRAIRNHFSEDIQEIIVHTGQHYDENMSNVFFEEMEIPKPQYNLQVGSCSHGKQTAMMIQGIEELLLKEKPDFIVLYGDTNSTLAGAIAASKIHIPIVHIEAGLRSFNKSMPEEINRIMCDHASTLLFSPTQTGFKNLIAEGFNPKNKAPFNADNPGIYHCGDVMYDNSLYFADLAENNSSILKKLNIDPQEYLLGTIHRDNNTDIPIRFNAIFNALDQISRAHKIPIVLPLHPRTSKLLEKNLVSATYESVVANPFIKIIPAVSFFDMVVLEKNARLILTDSGGVQKEAYFYQKPCIILRSETEWKEIIEQGAGIVSDANEENIIHAFDHFSNTKKIKFPPIFGDGKAAEFICKEIIRSAQHK